MKNLLNFDRERTPERVVHATGASAKGFFEVTLDVSHPTCADFLRAPGVQTPVIVRFLTVIHERGSPETLVVLPPSFTQGRTTLIWLAIISLSSSFVMESSSLTWCIA